MARVKDFDANESFLRVEVQSDSPAYMGNGYFAGLNRL